MNFDANDILRFVVIGLLAGMAIVLGLWLFLQGRKK